MMALTVHLLLYPEETWYVAHCLEFDLVAQGGTPLDAFKNLLDAIEVQAAYAQEVGDWGQLFVPAPAEYWQLLAVAKPYRPGANGWHLPVILSGIECAGVVTDHAWYDWATIKRKVNLIEDTRHAVIPS